MQPRSYIVRTVGFATAVCVVCAVLVSSSAVLLRDRQAVNVELDRKKNVLMAAGLLGADESVAAAEVESRFASFEVAAVELASGEEDPAFTVAGYDASRAQTVPATSRAVPGNPAGVTRVANHGLVYKERGPDGALQLVVLPIEGMGLWGKMKGFVALDADLTTIRGLTYYEHKETPGLGGEVDNPRWKQLWPGRQALDADGDLAIEVIRGRAGPVQSDPNRVDGLAGATITSRGVTAMLRFWLGEHGYGPYLAQLKKGGTDG
ncbi:MAG: Na(+)-translocating NADH-quinone reductase subunit C [Vicinamibacterales bacterium]|nr:Na(+)-translocating NADH-quinone reductase subunit C [Vicinamibacterales bacterium]